MGMRKLLATDYSLFQLTFGDTVSQKNTGIGKSMQNLRNHSLALTTLSASSVREALQDFRNAWINMLKTWKNAKRLWNPTRHKLELKTDFDELSIFASKSILPGTSARYSTRITEEQVIRSHLCQWSFSYNKHLVVPMKCIKYVYTESTNHLIFIWSETEILNSSAKKDLSCTPFVHSFWTVTHSKPASLRSASTPDRWLFFEQRKNYDERVSKADSRPHLWYDMPVNNKGHPETFETFWTIANNTVDTAVDDRRHDLFTGDDVLTHIATAMSVNDLHTQVTKMFIDILPGRVFLLGESVCRV